MDLHKDGVKNVIILFDLDGTLIDSTQAIYASFCAAYRAMGNTPPSLEAMKAYIGYTLEDMFLNNGISAFKLKEYVNHYRIHYRALMESGTQLLPHAREAIERASEFAILGVVTTKRGDFSQILLQKLGVWEYMSDIVGIESVSSPKPSAQPILMALQRIASKLHVQIPNDKIYMVGDTILDLQAAHNAKIKCVGVECGFGNLAQMQQYAPMSPHTLHAVEYIAQKCAI